MATKLKEFDLDRIKAEFKRKNPGKTVEVFRSPHPYATDAEVDNKISSVKAAHHGWTTLLSGYIEENGGKRAVVLHYKP